MTTDRKDRRNEPFTNLEKGVRADEFIFGDIGYTEADMTGMSQAIDGLLTDTPVPDPDPTADPTVTITLAPNTLIPDRSVNNYTTEVGAAWAETTDDPIEPTNDAVIGVSPPTGFTSGLVGTLSAVSGWSVTEVRRLYQYDDVNGIVEILSTAGISGISITSVANTTPLAITDFVSSNATDTTFDVTFSLTTCPPDDLTLQYDIVDTTVLDGGGSPIIYATGGDITSGATITGLTPGIEYSPAVRVTPGGDDTREYTSDPDPISTTSLSTITFTAFVLTDGGATESDAVVDTLTTTGNPDEFYQSLTPIAPVADSVWTSIPAESSEIDLGSAGDIAVYAYVRLSTDPTNIVAFANNPATVTLAPDSGGDIFSIDSDNTDLVISEIGAPTGTITVVRSAETASNLTVDITSTDGTAIAGTNYHTLTQTISFDSGIKSVAIPYDVLLANIGHNNGVPYSRDFSIALSNESAGSVNVVNGSATITITGSTGFVGSDSAIDVNNPPILSKLTGAQTVTNGQILDLVDIDAAGSENAIIIPEGANNVKIRRAILRNAGRSMINFIGNATGLTIENVLGLNWHADWMSYDGSKSDNRFIGYNGSFVGGSRDISNTTVRGVKARGHGRFFVCTYASNSSGFIVDNNHFTNTSNIDLGMTRTEFSSRFNVPSFNVSDGHFFQLYNNRAGQHSCRDNIARSPRSGTEGGCVKDMINIGDVAPTSEANRTFIEGNGIWGSVDRYGDPDLGGGASAFAFIMDTLTSGGYVTMQYNQVIEFPQGGISAGAADHFLARRNGVYNSDTTEDVSINGVALGSGRTTNSEFTDNDVMYWKINTSDFTRQLNLYFVPSSSVTPTGWSSQNEMDGTDGTFNWRANGETTVKGLKAILNNPGIGHGFKTKYASSGCPVGNGLLRWDETKLYFTAYGDSEGPGVTVNQTPDSDPAYGDATTHPNIENVGWHYDYTVYSGNSAAWIRVIVNPAMVAALGASYAYKVQVTNFPYIGNTMIQPYNQTTNAYIEGKWEGVDLVTISGSTKPATPTNLAVVAGSGDGEADLSWDDMGEPQYRVYRSDAGADSVLITTVSTNSYTDTGLSNGVLYVYQVVSLTNDTPPVPSDISSPISYTPTDTLPGQLEALDNVAWTDFNLVGGVMADNSDGTYTAECAAAFTSGVYKTVTVATGGVPYNVVIPHMGILGTKGRVAADNSTAGGNIWAGDLISDDVDEYATLHEYTYQITPTSTTFKLCLSTYHSNIGDTTIFGIPRVNAA